MSKFRVQFSDVVKERTVEVPKGPYKVCLEGYFDFNEALVKLMIMNGSTLPVSSQFEPGSESDNDSDMDFVEPQFDDVCDAIQLGRELEEKVNRPPDFVKVPQAKPQAKAKGKGNGEPLPKPKEEPTDPVSEVVE